MIKPTYYYDRKVGGNVQKDRRGDIVASTLQHYRERTKESSNKVPKPYCEIRKKLQKTVDEGKRVLVDIKESYCVQTVVVQFEYVGDRWAMGKSICYGEEGIIEVPYSIHYSDIYCNTMKIKVITEGENPIERP